MAKLPVADIVRRDEEYPEPLHRLLIRAMDKGVVPVDYNDCHLALYKFAMSGKGFSKKGANAWASWKVEEFQRRLVGLGRLPPF